MTNKRYLFWPLLMNLIKKISIMIIYFLGEITLMQSYISTIYIICQP